MKLFWKSFWEVFWLSCIAFFPIVLSLIFQLVKLDDFNSAIEKILHPSEIIAFCLSFLAPSIFFIKKTHGLSYKLPFLSIFYVTTLFMYVLSIFFVILIKNNIDPDITKNLKTYNYIYYALIFLFFTILYRVYSTYHQSKSSDFVDDKKKDEKDFTAIFKRKIHEK